MNYVDKKLNIFSDANAKTGISKPENRSKIGQSTLHEPEVPLDGSTLPNLSRLLRNKALSNSLECSAEKLLG